MTFASYLSNRHSSVHMLSSDVGCLLIFQTTDHCR